MYKGPASAAEQGRIVVEIQRSFNLKDTRGEKVKEEQRFEEAVKRLEDIVAQLEKGEIDLDESLTMFEEGVKLSRFCRAKLDEAEKRISLLLKDEAGIFQREPFSLSPNEEPSGTDS